MQSYFGSATKIVSLQYIFAYANDFEVESWKSQWGISQNKRQTLGKLFIAGATKSHWSLTAQMLHKVFRQLFTVSQQQRTKQTKLKLKLLFLKFAIN